MMTRRARCTYSGRTVRESVDVTEAEGEGEGEGEGDNNAAIDEPHE